jgi:putative ABC transport system permease protein
LLFGLAPFLTSVRIDIHDTLKSAARSGEGGRVRQRTRGFLVLSEVALSVTLLVAAALLIQSLYRLHQERLGFAPHGLITFRTPSTAARVRKPAEVRVFEETLAERLRTVPGIRSVAAVSQFPLTSQFNFPTEWMGHPDVAIGGMEIRIVTPGYFEAMEIPVLRGRAFTGRDVATAAPVILVNETVSRRWWQGRDPLGGQVKVGRYQGKDYSPDPPREVVGVVADTKTVFLKQPPRPTVYVPVAQAPWYTDGMSWVIRTNLSAGLAESLRRAVAEVDAAQRLEGLRTVDQILASSTADSRFDAWLFGSFAGLALVLTAVGVYGMLAFSVARRTNEIGIRMALGANRGAVLRLVLREGLKLTTAGLALGLAGALVLTRYLSNLLFGVLATDPASFVAVSAVLLIVGLLASYLPARRATKVDPLVALRND